MTEQSSRPFYGEYAWALDLLIDRPIGMDCANDAGEHSSDYRFVMRCWTRSDLESALVRSGFESLAYFGAYDPAVDAGATDRLVAVAQLPEVSTESPAA